MNWNIYLCVAVLLVSLPTLTLGDEQKIVIDAIHKGDVSLCSRIVDPTLSHQCSIGASVSPVIQKAIKTKNPELCKTLDKGFWDQCYYGIAHSNDDGKYCDLIENEKMEEHCWTETLERSPNKSLQNCNDLPPLRQDACRAARQTKSNSIEDCKTTISQSENQAKCILTIATEKSSPDVCNSIQELKAPQEIQKNYFNQCILTLVEKQSDETLCLKTIGQNTQTQCLAGLALKTQNRGLCLKLPTTSSDGEFVITQQTCIQGINARTQKPQ